MGTGVGSAETKPMNKKIQLLLPAEAARHFDPPISADRVRQLVDIGDLAAFVTPSGHRLIPLDAVRALVERRRQAKLAGVTASDDATVN